MSAPAAFDFPITQGESFRMELALDIGGTPLDLTGATFAGQIRREARAAESLAAFAFEIGDAAGGKVVAQLSPATTAALPIGRLVYDWWMTSAHSVVTPLCAGAAQVHGRVTR